MQTDLLFGSTRIKGEDAIHQLQEQIKRKKERLSWMIEAIENEGPEDSCDYYPTQKSVAAHKAGIHELERKLTAITHRKDKAL